MNLIFGFAIVPMFTQPKALRTSVFPLLTAVLSFALLTPAHAQLEQDFHSEAALISESNSIQPGKPFTVALRINLEKGWHTYWRNAGDSGYPVRITWNLPAGFKAGAIQWPHPHRFPTPPLMTYGYEDEVWLLAQITPPANLPAGKEVNLGAKADWLVCSEECIPADADLSVKLTASDEAPKPEPKWANGFTTTRSRLPVSPKQAGYTVRVERAPGKSAAKANLEIRLQPVSGKSLPAVQASAAYFYCAEPSVVAHAAPQKVTLGAKAFRVSVKPSDDAEAPAKRLRGVLVAPSATGNPLVLWIDEAVAAPARPAPQPKAKLTAG